MCWYIRDRQCSLQLMQHRESDSFMIKQAAVSTCEMSMLSVRGSFVGLASSSKFARNGEVCS